MDREGLGALPPMEAALNGLVSQSPSQGAVRLSLGGFLLLIVQNALLLLAPELEDDLRGLIWFLTFIAMAALVASLVGPPEPPADYWSRRHGR